MLLYQATPTSIIVKEWTVKQSVITNLSLVVKKKRQLLSF